MADQRLELRPRNLLGKKVGRLRRQGILPAVIFGHGDSVPVQLDSLTFELAWRRWGRTTLITLTGVDGDIPALVHDVTRDPRSGDIIHVDFYRVSLTEKTAAEVPLHFVGESNAVKNLSAVLYHQIDSVRVEALPQDIPHRIDVELTRLETMDDAVFVRDLSVDGAKIRILNDPDELVVKVVPQRAEEVAPAPAVEAAPVAEGEEAVEAGEAPAAPAAGPSAPAPAGKATATPTAQQPAKPQAQQPAKK